MAYVRDETEVIHSPYTESVIACMNIDNILYHIVLKELCDRSGIFFYETRSNMKASKNYQNVPWH